MPETGVPFWSEYCKKCKIALDLPAYANGRCDLCGNEPTFKWLIYRHHGSGVDLCTPEEIARFNEYTE